MSTNVILIVVGAVLFLVGLAKFGNRGGFNLLNRSFNIGSTNTQTIKTGNITPDTAKETKPDWVGLAIAVLGLLTALVGWLKG
jgi:hypothetical protein